MTAARALSCLLLLVPAGCAGGGTAPPDDPADPTGPGAHGPVGSAVAEGEALDLGEGRYSLCVPAPEGQDVLLGDTLVTNRAESSVTLVAVELVGVRGLELVAGYAVEPMAIEYEVDGTSHHQRTRTALAVTRGRCDGGHPVPGTPAPG